MSQISGALCLFDVRWIVGSSKGSLVGDTQGRVIESIARFKLTGFFGMLNAGFKILRLVVCHGETQMSSHKSFVFRQDRFPALNFFFDFAFGSILFGVGFQLIQICHGKPFFIENYYIDHDVECRVLEFTLQGSL